MEQNPSEETISQAVELLNLDPVVDRRLLVSALKAKSLEQVVSEYFENGGREYLARTYGGGGWDEAAFTAERDGTNTTGISFQIDSMDNADIIQGVTPPPDGYRGNHCAPSRPPSRTNTKSPLGRLTDWTAPNASAPTTQEQEDADMASAMKASMEDQHMGGQETGIVGQDDDPPALRAATRDYYGPEWQVQAVGPSTSGEGSRIIGIAGCEPPSLRRRVADAPAFLVFDDRQSDVHRLGAVITILHEIPLARNVLMAIGDTAESYGHNSKWWTGQPIVSAEKLRAMNDDSPFQDTSTDIFHELHRLMAFLDDTQRAYGSVSVLADSVMSSTYGKERAFYDELIERSPADIKPLCSTAVMASIQDDSLDGEEATFGIVEMEYARDNFDQIKTLCEAWDHMMWANALTWHSVEDGARMAMFTGMGEVIMTVFSGDGPAESIEIPEVWYPERYLTTRKEEARRLQEHWVFTKKALYNYLQVEYQSLNWTHTKSNKVNKQDAMLEAIIELHKNQCRFLESRAIFRAASAAGLDEEATLDLNNLPWSFNEEEQKLYDDSKATLQRHEAELTNLKAKMERLEEERRKIRERQRQLGRVFTDPENPGAKPFTCKKYYLRGIAVSPNITYVCRRTPKASQDLIEFDDDAGPQDQWWRLAYKNYQGASEPVEATKLDLSKVLREVWAETKTPLVVYATEEAIDAKPLPLPAALKTFVKFDNKVFEKELGDEANNPTSHPAAHSGAMPSSELEPIIVTVSPGAKRKYRHGSPDSMDTNRASLGSDTDSRIGGFDDDPFVDGDSIGTELMQFPPPPTVDGPQESPGRPVAVSDDDKAPEMQEMTGPSLFLPRSAKQAANPDTMNVEMTVSDDQA